MGRDPGATSLLLRSNLRRRWLSLLVVALVAGLGAGAALAAVAGARRTISAPARLYEERRMPDAMVLGRAGLGPDDLRVIATVRGIESVHEVQITLLAPTEGPAYSAMNGNPVAVWLWGPGVGSEARIPEIVEGRAPDPAAFGEAVISPRHARTLGLEVGDQVRGLGWTPEDLGCVMAGACGSDISPTVPLDLEIVGLARFPDELDADSFADQPVIEAGPATLAALRGQVGGVGSIASLDLDPADAALRTSTFEAQSVLAERIGAVLPPAVAASSVPLIVDPGEISATDALRLQAAGLVAGGLLLALVSLGASTVLFSRHLLGSVAEQPVLSTLGLRRAERSLPLAAEGLAAGLVAAVVAVGLAVGLSPLLPFGIGRRAEPDPGLTVDPAVIALGFLAVAVVLGAAFAAVAHRATRIDADRRPAPARPTLASRVRLGPVPGTGARLALEGRPPGRRAAVALTVGVTAGAITLVVAASVLTFSIHHSLTDPAAAGSPWDGYATQSGPPEPLDREHAEALLADPRVVAAAVVGQGQLRVDAAGADEPLVAIGIDQVAGEVHPTVLRGRAPFAPDEAMLGSGAADRLGLEIGDQLVAQGPEGPRALRIVGVGLLPVITSEANGDGVVVPLSTLVDLDGFATPGANEAGVAYRVSQQGDLDAVNRLAEQIVADGTIALPAQLPGTVRNLEEVRALPRVMSWLVAGLAVLTVGFGLLLTVRQRGRELGVLQALGFRPADARGAVHWQGIVTAAAGLAIGVPLGLVAGRQAWRALADTVGQVSPAPSMPWPAVGAVSLVALLIGALLSVGPAWRAGRLRPAEILRAE